MDKNIDKTLRLSPRTWRWLWVFVIIGCSLDIGSRLVSGGFTWWDFLFPSAGIAVGVSALTARRVFSFVLILFAIAVTTQLIHELVTPR
jgi:hypothetical protein